jgi:hypothetical protein
MADLESTRPIPSPYGSGFLITIQSLNSRTAFLMSNPYESPATTQTEVLPNSRIRRRVWWPAAVLVALCVVQLLGLGLPVVAMISFVMKMAQTGKPFTLYSFVSFFGWLNLATIALSGGVCLAILMGAWKALRLRSLTMARMSAALACIPLLTPLVVAGLPFGVWLLVVLFQRETTAAFQRLELARNAAPKRKPEP